jgi:hypothetical protein
MTKVPGIGGASIHCRSVFKTCKACISGSCHNIVKHFQNIRLNHNLSFRPVRLTSQLDVYPRFSARTQTSYGCYLLSMGSYTDYAAIYWSRLRRIMEKFHGCSWIFGLIIIFNGIYDTDTRLKLVTIPYRQKSSLEVQGIRQRVGKVTSRGPLQRD